MSAEDVLAGDVPAPLHEKRSFLDVRDLRVHFPTDDGVVKVGRRVVVPAGAGQAAGHRGGVRAPARA